LGAAFALAQGFSFQTVQLPSEAHISGLK
jgi:hypothetical protein